MITARQATVTLGALLATTSFGATTQAQSNAPQPSEQKITAAAPRITSIAPRDIPAQDLKLIKKAGINARYAPVLSADKKHSYLVSSKDVVLLSEAVPFANNKYTFQDPYYRIIGSGSGVYDPSAQLAYPEAFAEGVMRPFALQAQNNPDFLRQFQQTAAWAKQNKEVFVLNYNINTGNFDADGNQLFASRRTHIRTLRLKQNFAKTFPMQEPPRLIVYLTATTEANVRARTPTNAAPLNGTVLGFLGVTDQGNFIDGMSDYLKILGRINAAIDNGTFSSEDAYRGSQGDPGWVTAQYLAVLDEVGRMPERITSVMAAAQIQKKPSKKRNIVVQNASIIVDRSTEVPPVTSFEVKKPSLGVERRFGHWYMPLQVRPEMKTLPRTPAPFPVGQPEGTSNTPNPNAAPARVRPSRFGM